MNQLTIEFFRNSSIPQNADTVAVMDYLTMLESVNRMKVMSDIGLPALTGVVKELENQFGSCSLFPLNHNASDANAPNRRNVGWMIRFVMRAYGYTPIARGLMDTDNDSERTRVKKFGSKYFGSAAVYTKTNENPQYKIVITCHKNVAEVPDTIDYDR